MMTPSPKSSHSSVPFPPPSPLSAPVASTASLFRVRAPSGPHDPRVFVISGTRYVPDSSGILTVPPRVAEEIIRMGGTLA